MSFSFSEYFHFHSLVECTHDTNTKKLALPTKNHEVELLSSFDCCRREERERHDLPHARRKKKHFDREKQKIKNFSNRINSLTLMEAALEGTNFGAAAAAGVVVDAESSPFSARVMLILL